MRKTLSDILVPIIVKRRINNLPAYKKIGSGTLSEPLSKEIAEFHRNREVEYNPNEFHVLYSIGFSDGVSNAEKLLKKEYSMDSLQRRLIGLKNSYGAIVMGDPFITGYFDGLFGCDKYEKRVVVRRWKKSLLEDFSKGIRQI